MSHEAAFPYVVPVGAMSEVDPGMSLRDWFAGQMANGIKARDLNDRFSWEQTAHHAYLFADAMLAERAKTGGGL